MAGRQAKHWCFTLNNPKNGYDDLNNVKDWSYMVAGKEIGENGTPHLQGYVAFNKRYRFNAVKTMLPTAHLEVACGTPLEASDYCKKDGDYFEAGELPQHAGHAGGEANRQRCKRVIELAKKRDLMAIEDEAPDLYLRHYSTLKRIGMDNPPDVMDIDKLEHEWLWGAPGVGKSRLARLENPGFYLKSHNKWWNGYKEQEVVLIDDLDHDTAKWIGQFLKNWCDHYPFQAETKGDNMYIRPKKIVVTSNYTIEELFLDPSLAEAIKRRFKVRNIIQPFILQKSQTETIIDGSEFAEHSFHSQEEK